MKSFAADPLVSCFLGSNRHIQWIHTFSLILEVLAFLKYDFLQSRLTVVSHVAKESRIKAHAIIKSVTTVRIYTHNNGACIHPYQNTMLRLGLQK